MTSLSDYLEGVMRVPLALLTSDGFSECPSAFSDAASVSDFEGFLSNHDQPITGIVSPQKLDRMLEQLGISRQEFRQSLHGEEALLNSRFKIDALLGQHCLEKAKSLLGQSHGCIVRIYSIPSELPGRYSDGEICRQVLLLQEQQPSLAQKWLERLSRGKRKHVTMVFNRNRIWTAMRQVANFPGLWDDIKLGNWAKHLAAHIDEQVLAYWKHIYRAWNDKIFDGVDPSLRRCLDAPTARFLQFKAPAWSARDQKAIRMKMKTGTLFCNVSNEGVRSRLLRNLLAFEGVIPSVLTFHENMRYLTVGAKILEKYIEIKRPTEKAKPDLAPAKTPESLYDNLAQDWGKKFPIQDYVEFREGLYRSMLIPLEVRCAFVQLMLAALRSFPFLGSEPPLQDVKGIGMDAYACDNHRRRLCMIASAMGFWNEKIEKGLQLSDLDIQPKIPEFVVLCAEPIWRGGLPTISVFEELRTKSFLPTLASAALVQDEREPNPTLIQHDFVQAFFGNLEVAVGGGRAILDYDGLRGRPLFDISTSTHEEQTLPSDAPRLDLAQDMDWVESDNPFEKQKVERNRRIPITRKKTKKKGPSSHAGVAKRNQSSRVAGGKTLTKAPKNSNRRIPSPVPEESVAESGAMDTSVDEPVVPGTHQRRSAPTVDDPEALLQGEPQPEQAEDSWELRVMQIEQIEQARRDREVEEQKKNFKQQEAERKKKIQGYSLPRVKRVNQIHQKQRQQEADPEVPEPQQRRSTPAVDVFEASPQTQSQNRADKSDRLPRHKPIYRKSDEITGEEIRRRPQGYQDRERKRFRMLDHPEHEGEPSIPEMPQSRFEGPDPEEEEEW
ncbi:uncharacterized protein FTOL_06876 [Fusarium torulosum]|uniref:Uncharacterized protein n=1 Tax=Fusarium torulosum TaxID=33205 RepID=A0AAE8SJ81_9HYPO|nr:uncharacterized protein FTOL_06876 [Fusarium torulosum]